MSTAEETRTYTPEEYLALPDYDHYELVNGQLIEVTMSKLSSWVGGEILTLLREFCRRGELGWVWPSDNVVRCFPDPAKFRKPDVSFVRRARMSWDDLDGGVLTIAPDLVVEVLSPHDLIQDIDERLKDYEDAGVPLVWVVNPELRTVRIHRIDGTITGLKERDELTGEDVIPGFRCPVAALFPPRPTA